MVEETIQRMRRLTRSFVDDDKGNVAVIFTLALLPLVSAAGAAVDFSHGNSVKTGLQAAVDATTLMAAKDAASAPIEQIEQKAVDYFKAQFTRGDVRNVQVAINFDGTAPPTVKVSASVEMGTDFMGVMGIPTMKIVARAAGLAMPGGDACVLSLNAQASGAVTAQGTPNVALKGCSLYDNSSSNTALKVGGAAQINALSVNVVGSISGIEKITTTHGVRTGQAPLADPYAKLQLPAFSGCTQKNFTAKDAITINPGVYCGGMKINAGANVTLNPGIYFLDQGSFSVNGGATVTGEGVTLVFTSNTLTNWATATINGGATVSLAPPTSGDFQGLVIVGDRRMPPDSDFKFNGGSTQTFEGVVYLPSAAVTFTGGSNTGTNCTKMIADTVTFSGNSNFAIDCKGLGTKDFGSPSVRLLL